MGGFNNIYRIGQHVRGHDWFPLENFPLYVNRHVLTMPIKSHDHDCDELCIVTEGKSLLINDHIQHPISAGDVFVCHRGDTHSYEESENFISYVILFDFSGLNIDLKDIVFLQGFQSLFTLEPILRSQQRFQNQLHLESGQLNKCVLLIQQIMDEFEHKTEGCRFTITALFEQLVGYLARCYSQANASVDNHIFQIANVISLMEKRYQEHLSIHDLVEAGCISERTLRRHFKKIFGVSPIDYLTSLRISKAETLLRQSNLNITEIALRCGFSDSNYFSRAFRKIHLMSPREYRRSCQI